MKFEKYQDAANEWRWSLRSDNGNIVADSGEGYKEERDCDRGIELVKGAGNAPVTQGRKREPLMKSSVKLTRPTPKA